MPKNTQNDKMLAFLFVIAIVFNFYLISLVSASFENGESETLFISDSATTFAKVEKAGYPYTTTDNITTSLEMAIGTTVFQFDKTPVYVGNNTWSIPINATTTGQDGLAVYVIELPNLDSWIIDEIVINQTSNSDSDLKMQVNVFSVTDNTYNYGETYTTIFSNFGVGGSSTWNNQTIDVSLSNALNILDVADGNTKHFMTITQADNDDDGLGAFSWNIEVEITGKKIQTYNLMQQLEIAVGINIIVAGFITVFMNDRIDIGGFINDIPDKKRR